MIMLVNNSLKLIIMIELVSLLFFKDLQWIKFGFALSFHQKFFEVFLKMKRNILMTFDLLVTTGLLGNTKFAQKVPPPNKCPPKKVPHLGQKKGN